MAAKFLKRAKAVQPQASQFPYVRVDRKQDNSLSDGTHAFIMGFGKMSELDLEEGSWVNADPEHDGSAVPMFYCQFWLEEKADEKNKYVRWFYIGDGYDEDGNFDPDAQDPVHVLGLDTQNQDMDRRAEIWGSKFAQFATAQPEWYYVVPVLPVEQVKKEYDIEGALEEGNYSLLILNQHRLGDIIKAAENLATQDDPAPYGRVMVVTKNTAKGVAPKDMYNISIPFLNPVEDEGMDKQFAAARKKAIADVEAVWDEANGEGTATDVWNYLTSHFGGTRDELIQKYCVKTNFTMTPTDEVEI